MDMYLLAIVTLIIISIWVILYVRISRKINNNPQLGVKPNQNDNLINYNNIVNTKSDLLSHLKADDFTLVE